MANLFFQFSSLASAFSGPYGAGIGLASQLALSFQKFFTNAADLKQFDMSEEKDRDNFISDSCLLLAFRKKVAEILSIEEKKKSLEEALRIDKFQLEKEASCLELTERVRALQTIKKLEGAIGAIAQTFKDGENLLKRYEEFDWQVNDPGSPYFNYIKKWIDKLEKKQKKSRGDKNLLNKLRDFKKGSKEEWPFDGINDKTKERQLRSFAPTMYTLLQLETRDIERQKTDADRAAEAHIAEYMNLQRIVNQKQDALSEMTAYLASGKERGRAKIYEKFNDIHNELLGTRAPEYLDYIAEKTKEDLAKFNAKKPFIYEQLRAGEADSWKTIALKFRKLEKHRKERVCSDVFYARTAHAAAKADAGTYSEYCEAFSGKISKQSHKEAYKKCKEQHVGELADSIPPPPPVLNLHTLCSRFGIAQ